MNRPTLVAALACLALVLAPLHAHAHSGGTDAQGCHTDSSTGTRHCHTDQGGGGDATVSQIALISGAVGLIGLGCTVYGFLHDDVRLMRIIWPVIGIAAHATSFGVGFGLLPDAREHEPDQRRDAYIGLGVANGLGVVLAVLVVSGVTAMRHDSVAAIDVSGGRLALSPPAVDVSADGGVMMPALFGARF